MMNVSQTGKRERATTWLGDLWGGLASMLVAVPSAIAFGVIVYSALGPGYAGAGAMAGILGAAALGLVAPLVGQTGGLISAPCAPAAAVLAALVTDFLNGRTGLAVGPEGVLPVLALTVLLAAVLQALYGAVGGGHLIKFIPYPVVSGYLSGVGVLIALGQFPKLLGISKGVSLVDGLLSPATWSLQNLAIGFVTIVVMTTAARFTRRIPASILGLFGGMATYGIMALCSDKLAGTGNTPFVIGTIQTTGTWGAMLFERVTALRMAADMSILRAVLVPAFTLSILLSIDTLKTCVALDAITRTRHRSNRELIGQGLGNLAACLAGGIPGAGTMGPTLINVSSGGRTPRAGVIEGLAVILTLVLLRRYIAWIPVAALAGILLVLAWRIIDRSMFRLLRTPAGRMDFLVIMSVIVVAVAVDLVAAAGVGLVLAILLFMRDQVRGSIIRQKHALDIVASKTRRPAAEREILNRFGNRGLFCELQGNLFFGTTDQLYRQLESDLAERKYVLLDLRRVHSMDYTAAHLFEQMHAQLAERGGQLLFSGMPSALIDRRDFERYLVRLGIVRTESGIRIFDTLDGALEWMETQILVGAGASPSGEAPKLSVTEFDLFKGLPASAFPVLDACLTTRPVAAGEKIFGRGESGDTLFLVRRGSVRILLPLEGGKHHHVATVGRGEFFGEMAFLDNSIRSADVEAKEPTELFVLSRARFNLMAASVPLIATALFARLAGALAERLRHADAELQTLQER